MMYKSKALICPITVAMAAPATPSAGKPSNPKIRIGSRYNIDDTAGDEKVHCNLHFTDSLEDLFKCNLKKRAERKAKYDFRIYGCVV